MDKIKLNKDMMNILLAAKHGKVEQTIFQLVYGRDDVDYEDKNDTLIYWLEQTVHTISKQEHKCRVGCRYTLSEYYMYVERYKRLYDPNLTDSEGIVKFLTYLLRGCEFRKYVGEELVNIFEVVD